MSDRLERYRMERSLRDVVTHPSGRTAIATVVGYSLILLLMTLLLFGGGWMAFAIFG